MQRFTRIFIALSLFGLGANLFFYRAFTLVSFALFEALFLTFILVTAKKIHRSVWILVALFLCATLIILLRSTTVVLGLGAVFIIASVLNTWYVGIREKGYFSNITEVLFTPLFSLFTYIRMIFMMLTPKIFMSLFGNITQALSNRSKHSKIISVVFGIIISIPILTILIGFFASADPVYYSYVQKVFSPEFIRQIPWRIFLTIFVVILAIPLILPDIRHIYFSPGNILTRLHISREMTIVMAGVALVMASFILVQWKYIFVAVSAETQLSQYGVATYAEYVTRGFLELIRVSFFIYILLWFGLSALRNTQFKPKFLTVLQLIVLGEFMIILVSIFRRVYLYQLYHGLTLIRVYGTVFLILLSFMTITLLIRHFSQKSKIAYFEGVFILLLFVSIGFWNAEKFIAVQDPPTVNKHVDYVYLSRMSPDGVDGWIKSFIYVDTVLKKYENQEGVLDETARKEIAYTNYILRKLSLNYQELSIRQATQDEFKDYFYSVYHFQKKQLQKEIDELAIFKSTPNDQSWIESRAKDSRRSIALLDELEKYYRTKERIDSMDVADIRISMWNQDLPTFDQFSSPYLHSLYESQAVYYDKNHPNWYQKTIVDEVSSYSKLDRLYLFNKAEKNAYMRLQSEVRIENLLKMQERYYKLQEKIESQNERNYSVDISFDSPLL